MNNKQTILSLFNQINVILTDNLKKSVAVVKEDKYDRGRLQNIYEAKVETLEELLSADNLRYMDKHLFSTFLTTFFKKNIKDINFNFYISHIRNNNYSFVFTSFDKKLFGVDNSFNTNNSLSFDFKISFKQVDFSSGRYNFSQSKELIPFSIKLIDTSLNELSFKDILANSIASSLELQKSQIERKNNEEQTFQEKLKELNITELQYKELLRVTPTSFSKY
jgi:hypothetical protein